jgi:hypothetical protein
VQKKNPARVAAELAAGEEAEALAPV